MILYPTAWPSRDASVRCWPCRNATKTWPTSWKSFTGKHNQHHVPCWRRILNRTVTTRSNHVCIYYAVVYETFGVVALQGRLILIMLTLIYFTSCIPLVYFTSQIYRKTYKYIWKTRHCCVLLWSLIFYKASPSLRIDISISILFSTRRVSTQRTNSKNWQDSQCVNTRITLPNYYKYVCADSFLIVYYMCVWITFLIVYYEYVDSFSNCPTIICVCG